MHIFNFFNNCLCNQKAALSSVKMALRDLYGKAFWFISPCAFLQYRLPQGGIVLLKRGHSFTKCFWPDVDRYEPDVREFLKHVLKPGSVFIDCGSNIGYFSVLAGSLVGKEGTVIAIEANPLSHALLETNLKFNNFGTAIHCALTCDAGEVELFMPVEGDVYSSLRKGGLVTGKFVRSFKVLGRTLDDVVKELSLSKVDVIKLDVEGAEMDVLYSANRILSDFRPTIIIEYGTNTWIDFGATGEDLKNLVKKHSYLLKMYNLQNKILDDVTDDVWLRPYTNLILVPEERIVEFKKIKS